MAIGLAIDGVPGVARGLWAWAARLAFALALAAAAVLPLATGGEGRMLGSGAEAFPGWPARYEGLALQPLPLGAREEAFARDFPGRVGRFSDGNREIVLRWVAAPTRKLHPAADCFRGSGYSVVPLPLRRHADGGMMGCFRAARGGESRLVCERIRETAGSQSWSDASAWYWSALMGSSAGPWWSEVIAQ